MTIPQRGDVLADFKRFDVLLEYVVRHGEDVEAKCICAELAHLVEHE